MIVNRSTSYLVYPSWGDFDVNWSDLPSIISNAINHPLFDERIIDNCNNKINSKALVNFLDGIYGGGIIEVKNDDWDLIWLPNFLLGKIFQFERHNVRGFEIDALRVANFSPFNERFSDKKSSFNCHNGVIDVQ